MSILRRLFPKVLLPCLFLSVAIFPLVEQEAGTAADPLTAEERAFVAAHGPIRYAPDPLFPPFEFLDSSGVARGITPDLLTVMGKKLGVEFRTVAYPTWSDVLEAVKQGKVDLLGTLTRTPEREGFLLFSRPYLSVPYVLFVGQNGGDPKTVEDMDSRRLGVVKNYGINTWLSVRHPNIHPVAVEDTATGLTMVATGQLDAMLEALPVGAQIVREKSLTNIRVVPRPIYSLPQHFGVRKGEPLLLSIVQKGLDSVTETERSTVLTASDGLQAVALYRERGKEIDLVLMDLTMPHMDGAEAFGELRRLNPDVRVVLASGYSHEDVASRFAGKGLDGVSQKPYTLLKVREALAGLLPKRIGGDG